MTRERGQSLVETALILAAFLSLLLGMGFAGQSLFIKQTLTERTQEAARWGAVNRYDVNAMRSLVLYGNASAASNSAASNSDGFDGLTANDVVVSNPGCPGPDCRITVAIPRHGVQSVEPVASASPIDDAPSKP